MQLHSLPLSPLSLDFLSRLPLQRPKIFNFLKVLFWYEKKVHLLHGLVDVCFAMKERGRKTFLGELFFFLSYFYSFSFWKMIETKDENNFFSSFSLLLYYLLLARPYQEFCRSVLQRPKRVKFFSSRWFQIISFIFRCLRRHKLFSRWGEKEK